LECLESLFASSSLQDLDLTSVRIHVNHTNTGTGTYSRTGTTSSSGRSPIPPGTPTTTITTTSSSSRSNSVSSTLRKSSKDLKLPTNLKPKGSHFFSGSTLSLGKGHNHNSSSNSNSLSNQQEQQTVEKRLCSELGFLRLGGIQVEVRKDKQVWKSHEVIQRLLPMLDKGKITHLDLSLDKHDAPLGMQSHLDEKTVLATFKMVGQLLPRLQTLVLKNWKMRLANDNKSCKEIGKCLAPLVNTLCGLTMDNCTVSCDGLASSSSSGGGSSGNSSYSPTSSSPRRIDCVFLSSILTNLKSLSDFSWGNFDSEQMPALAKALCESQGMIGGGGRLQFKLDGVSVVSIKNLLSSAGMKQNAATGVSIEYLGNQTVAVFKSKERSDHLMNRIKRFWE
jgi:hypothetical protein